MIYDVRLVTVRYWTHTRYNYASNSESLKNEFAVLLHEADERDSSLVCVKLSLL